MADRVLLPPPPPPAGAADTCIAMATGSVREILQWLDRRGSA